MDDIAGAPVKNGQILVLSILRRTTVTPVLEAGYLASKVPATGPLAEVATNCPHGAERGCACCAKCLGKSREALAGDLMDREIVHARGSANPEAPTLFHRHGATVGDAAQVDEGIGMHELLAIHTRRSVPPPRGEAFEPARRAAASSTLRALWQAKGWLIGTVPYVAAACPSRKHASQGSATPRR